MTLPSMAPLRPPPSTRPTQAPHQADDDQADPSPPPPMLAPARSPPHPQEFPGGITNGARWYPLYGGLQVRRPTGRQQLATACARAPYWPPCSGCWLWVLRPPHELPGGGGAAERREASSVLCLVVVGWGGGTLSVVSCRWWCWVQWALQPVERATPRYNTGKGNGMGASPILCSPPSIPSARLQDYSYLVGGCLEVSTAACPRPFLPSPAAARQPLPLQCLWLTPSLPLPPRPRDEGRTAWPAPTPPPHPFAAHRLALLPQITLELCDDKWPSMKRLAAMWEENRRLGVVWCWGGSGRPAAAPAGWRAARDEGPGRRTVDHAAMLCCFVLMLL